LLLKKYANYTSKISNAGSVFLGNYSCESAGDYASGTNHTLPTNGYARNYSGVSLDSFVKKITFQELTKEGIQKYWSGNRNYGRSRTTHCTQKCSNSEIEKMIVELRLQIYDLAKHSSIVNPKSKIKNERHKNINTPQHLVAKALQQCKR
jgi:hypothetical protein